MFSKNGRQEGGCSLSSLDQYQPISSQSQASDNDAQEMMERAAAGGRGRWGALRRAGGLRPEPAPVSRLTPSAEPQTHEFTHKHTHKQQRVRTLTILQPKLPEEMKQH